MEQHPIPRQITTFEFKLIGFMTIKQFIYLVVFSPLALIIYKLFPIPILNILLAFIVGGVGIALAFVPINDRPMEVWIRNFINRLSSPTQYFYQKNNHPLYFLKNLLFSNDPHVVLAHIDSQEKLRAYLSKTQKNAGQKKTTVVFPLKTVIKTKKKKEEGLGAPTDVVGGNKKVFLSGVVKNHKLIPLPGILIYIKDAEGQTLRLLKSNPNGIFATFNPLPAGEYFFDFKDPRSTYFFDKMKIRIEINNPKPLEFFSKELL